MRTVLEPGAQAFVDTLAAKSDPPIYTLQPEQARLVLEQAQNSVTPKPSCDALRGTVGDGINVCIFRNPDLDRTAVTGGVIYLHGGGWMLGSVHTHRRLMWELVKASGLTVVFVDFSRSPEARFPVALEESYAALQWFARHGEEHGIDGSHLAIAGDSAGANMATVVAMLGKVRGGVQPVAQALFYPVTSANLDSQSYSQFAEGPWLTRKAMEWFWEAYAPDRADRLNYSASPLLAPLELLSSSPPTLIITAEADVLRDEGEAYASRLMQAGVSTRAVRFLGTIHDFLMLDALAETTAARHAQAMAGQFLRLYTTPPRRE
jgi:acetyl esterase